MFWWVLVTVGLGHIVLYPYLPFFWSYFALCFCVAWLIWQVIGILASPHLIHLKRFKLITRTLVALSVFSVAATVGTWRADAIIRELLPEALDKQSKTVSFVVESIHDRSNKKTLFTAKILPVSVTDVRQITYDLTNKQIRLAWYSPPFIEPGQVWQANVILRRPRGMVNPGGFDYSAWLIAKGYQATGYLNGLQFASLTGFQQPSKVSLLRQNLDLALNAKQTQASVRFFKALLIGDRSGLSVGDWQTLQATGTVHLMAISGLHVGLVAGLGFLLGATLIKLMIYLGVIKSGWWYRLLAPSFAISLSYGYSLLAGFSVPTQRAFIAVCLINIAWIMGVRYSRWYLFYVAILLITLSEPFAWLQSGFWLSFGAVAILLFRYDGIVGHYQSRSTISRWRHKLRLISSMQLLLALAMCMPLWLLGFPASILSPIANLVAVPLVAGLFVPLLLLWVPLSNTFIGQPMLHFLAWVFDLLWQCLEWLAALPNAVFWPANGMQGIGLVVGALVVIFALLPHSVAMRSGAAGLLCLLLFGAQRSNKPLKIVALDVGQGLAIAIHQPQRTLLYDAGAAFSENFNAGQHIIAPYLRFAHVRELALMVSHADADHRGGAQAILAQFSPQPIWYGEQFIGLPASAQKCIQGQRWQVDDVFYRVLWPPLMTQSNTVLQTDLSGNNRSCVLEVEYLGFRFLLPGDIEKSVEQELVRAKLLNPVDVLIAPHHGSNTSSSIEFLDALKPKHIIVSAGFKSRYGHPHNQVLKRYAAIGATLWQTGEQGAITVTVESGSISIDSQRKISPKIWF